MEMRRTPGVQRPPEVPRPAPPPRRAPVQPPVQPFPAVTGDQTTWRCETSETMARHHDSLQLAESWSVDACNDPGCPCQRAHHPNGEWLDLPFERSHGGLTSHSFRLWTPTRVYFAHTHEGRITCQSVPRHPEYDTRTERGHIGT